MKIFCTKKHNKEGNEWNEARKWYESKIQEEKYNIIHTAIGNLNDLTENIGFAVKVETNGSKEIKHILGTMEHKTANLILEKAKQSLLELI